MNITIKYNENIDEFTDDLSLEMRLKRYIKKNFYPAYAIAQLCPIFLLGGAIRDLINANKPIDLDFVVLGWDNLDWIMLVFKKFNIEYSFNKFGGFRFTYNDTDIDLWLSNDLFSAMQYNVDGLFFDLRTNSLISYTFNDFINNGIILVNNENNRDNGREKKLIKFRESFNKNNK